MITLRTLPVLLLLAAGFAPLAPLEAQAGPILRRAQERKACQDFAGKLQAASSNPQQAQLVYQQGVLKLVETFGENPCGDIPAPVAAAPAPAPAAAVSPVTAPAPAAAAKPANPQQAQACQEFAGKLQGAQGNPAQAQQIYAMGTQKLSGMFGPNPCPNVPKP
ncbi:hypothetical protein [Cyanobium sp. FACHB-13342]|uniref:hypothetical protein n=1 Tax=Cyanobium sp. FACHB-13342 TaxID=2692793 RepID=UPI001681905C|nr:hypothetical protein [Cyanobium sp. FACHB-13342]MBD2421876.1 hypothetical protein [Cyanobium sp. FACHB-13342]